MNIPYGRHDVDEVDIENVIMALRSNSLTMGNFVDRFEKHLADFTQTSGAIAVSSGTAALHCAYSSVDLKNREVITSPMTFVATASTAALQGANIVFSDIEPGTGNIDPKAVEADITRKTSVVTCVDYAGNPAKLNELRSVISGKNILLFEDASHSLGSKYLNKTIGSFADLTIFSFFPTKNITTAEGGAIVSNNRDLLEKVRLFKMHGLVRAKKSQLSPDEGDWHQEVHNFGLNYRLSDIHAALGLSQLVKLEKFKVIRQEIFDFYCIALSMIPEIELPLKTPNSEPFWHLFPIQVPKESRKKLFDYLRNNGVIVQVNYIPVYLHPVFQKLGYRQGQCPNAEEFYRREISLPIHTKLTKSNLEYIIDLIIKFFK
jgi:dTDP-4-amino-4,6-dideoxygalactose transaminase